MTEQDKPHFHFNRSLDLSAVKARRVFLQGNNTYRDMKHQTSKGESTHINSCIRTESSSNPHSLSHFPIYACSSRQPLTYKFYSKHFILLHVKYLFLLQHTIKRSYLRCNILQFFVTFSLLRFILSMPTLLHLSL